MLPFDFDTLRSQETQILEKVRALLLQLSQVQDFALNFG